MLEKNYLWRIYWRLAGVIMLCVVMALAVVSYFSHRVFERELVPETEQKAATIANSVRALVLKATSHGVPVDRLYGVDQVFKGIVEDNKEFDYIAITDAQGNPLFRHGREPAQAAAYFRSAEAIGMLAPGQPLWRSARVGPQYFVSLPIVGEKPLGMLHIGVATEFVESVLLEVMLDVLVVLVVSLFFTLELLNFMAGARLASGLGEFAHQVERMRGGDFTASARMRANDEIGRLLRRIDAAIDHLNVRYEFLVDELQNKVRAAGAAGREALRPAIAALESVRSRYRFGSSVREVEAADEMNLNRIRAPLFTFILAEEMTRSFLPTYVSNLLMPIPGLSPQVVIGLPIMLFMLIVALGQPYLGSWSERIGRRTAMLTGAIIATIGFAATAVAFNLYDLLIWRALCAVGYAMVFVAAQGYVLDRTGQANRAQGFALFIGAIMVATVCGPSIGGILADNIGFRPAFAVSAIICALSLLAIARLPGDEVRTAASKRPARGPRMREITALLFNRRFMTLTGLAAMPSKIILTGVCFYLVPLYIVSIGNTTAMAGRMLMVYAVMMVMIVPLAANLSDAAVRRDRYVSLGLIVSGLSGMLLLLSESFLVVFGVVFLLGLGQALSIAAQSALVAEHCREEIRIYGHDAVYGVYRLLERLGNAMGPLIASLLVVTWGYQYAFVAISALVFVCGVAFTLFSRSPEPLPEPARP